jgi:hypothetical protein
MGDTVTTINAVDTAEPKRIIIADEEVAALVALRQACYPGEDLPPYYPLPVEQPTLTPPDLRVPIEGQEAG